jgi:hypothetical protein
MFFVIAACPRSGTHYAANMLRAAGLDVKHQAWGGKDGLVSHDFAGNPMMASSWDQQHHDRPMADVILHQVREPLATIGSHIHFNAKVQNQSAKSWWDYVCRCMVPYPLGTDMNLISLADFWIRWNAMAEARACYTYRVEDFKREWPGICAVIGQKGLPFPEEKVDRRHVPHPEITWGDIWNADRRLYERLGEAAIKYGYPAPAE